MNNQQEMPYERFLAYGAQSLTNAELLAVILRTGTANTSATELSRKILTIHDEENTSLSVLHELTMQDLKSIRGIGEVKAVKILCLSELSRRIQQESIRRTLSFSSPDSVAEYYYEQLRFLEQEHVLLLLLDTKLSLIREMTLSIGTASCSVLSPRDIFRIAAREGAVFVMLLHNHPSGDPTPSSADIDLTMRVQEAGRLVEIELVDHIVIGDHRYVSLKEAGYLK